MILGERGVLLFPANAISQNSNAEGLMMWRAGGIAVAITQDVSSEDASPGEQRVLASC